MRKEKHLEEEATEDEEVIYKIEVAANRYCSLINEFLWLYFKNLKKNVDEMMLSVYLMGVYLPYDMNKFPKC